MCQISQLNAHLEDGGKCQFSSQQQKLQQASALRLLGERKIITSLHKKKPSRTQTDDVSFIHAALRECGFGDFFVVGTPRSW